MKDFETVIGLEVHLQFNTRTKNFCGCANTFGAPPNTNTCPVCLGLPGSLPVLNRESMRHALTVAAALQCTINPVIKFDRKNYYYPDLPKGFQISQYDLPVGVAGHLTIKTDGQHKTIGITRAHLEEDTGKLIHDPATKSSLVDYNRTGTPLMEIVSEPDIRSPQEAHDYLTALKLTLQYLEVSDCDMEKGSLRCDANISLRKPGEQKLGVKIELKNMNSFKAVKAALECEERRQQKLLSDGTPVIQETRLWDENTGSTEPMRSKEEAHDYRYFPEPDLVSFTVSNDDIARIRAALPEAPLKKLERFTGSYHLSEYDAYGMIQDKNLAGFFEACAQCYPHPKKICNWLSGPVQQEINTRKKAFSHLGLTVEHFVSLISQVDSSVISNLAGKDILRAMIDTGTHPEELIKNAGVAQISDEHELRSMIDAVCDENPQATAQVQQGKESAIGFLVGQVMKRSGGAANPKLAGNLIRKKLTKL